MAKIILESWREGLEKVSLTKLQVEVLGLTLKESKSNVDRLLEDNEVIIEIINLELGNVFLLAANKIGVNCRLIE